MNRTLRRPMFRIGGSAGTGITSGLDQPRKQYKEGTPNPYASNLMPGTLPGFLTSFGLDLLSRPPQGGFFQTVAASAKGPFETFQAAEMARAREQSEKDFLRSERLAGQEFEKGQLEKRLKSAEDIAAMKSDQSLTVNQLATTYLDDYDGDLNKATNKAKFFLEVRPELAGTVGETQIGGIIEADLSNEKQAKTFARANRNKVGKVFWDINTGTLKKLVKDPETNALGFVDFSMTGDMQPDTEGENLPEEEKNITTPKSFEYLSEKQKEKLKEIQEGSDSEFGIGFYD